MFWPPMNFNRSADQKSMYRCQILQGNPSPLVYQVASIGSITCSEQIARFDSPMDTVLANIE